MTRNNQKAVSPEKRLELAVFAEPNYFSPNAQSPAVNASALCAFTLSLRSIPNKENYFETVPFSVPTCGEDACASR